MLAPRLIYRYNVPRVRKGEVVTCLCLDRDCRVTSWTNARIPWPRAKPIGQRGGTGLWVNTAIARAIRAESALALRYWFGVTAGIIRKWQREFAGGRARTTLGSLIAIRGAAVKTVASIKVQYGARTKREVKLLGTSDDDVIALRIGRTPRAVQIRRIVLKIPEVSGQTAREVKDDSGK